MNFAHRVLFGCAGVVATAATIGCAKQETPAAASEPAAAKAPPVANEEAWSAEQLAFIREKFGELERTPGGIFYKVLQPGVGDAKPARANLCTVHYRGSFLDGRVFDESYKRNKPFKFRVGVPGVIEGWNQTVAEMHKGEKRLVVIPYWLAYGTQGRIPVIMPRTPLVFEIELLDWETTARVPTGP